jgi:hypothetical protein
LWVYFTKIRKIEKACRLGDTYFTGRFTKSTENTGKLREPFENTIEMICCTGGLLQKFDMEI